MGWFLKFRRRQESAALEPEGIRGFNMAAVYVLGKLYASFPAPCDFDVLREQIGMAVDAVASSESGRPGDVLAAKYLPDTLRWLTAEGYIRVSQALGGDYFHVDLTERAMKVLGQVPAAIRGQPQKKPLGELMRETAVEKGIACPMELASDLVKFLLSASS